MKEFRNRHGGRARGFLVAVAVSLFAGPAAAQTQITVKPGDTITISWPVTIQSDSLFTVGVQVSVDTSSCSTDTEQSQTIAIAAGQTQTASVQYKIAADAENGTCTVAVHIITTQPNVAATVRDSVITLKVAGPPKASVLDGNGITVASNTYSGTDTTTSQLFVVAQDSGSGIAQIIFPGFPPVVFSSFSVVNSTTVEFDNVSNGSYVVQVFDNAGNETDLAFDVLLEIPTLSVVPNAATFRLDDEGVQGVSTNTPSDLPVAYSFVINDPLGSTGFSAPPGTVITVPAGATPSSIPPGTNLIEGTIPALPAGSYTLSASNSAGPTSVSWRTVNLAVSLAADSNTSATFDGANFNASLDLGINSTLALGQIVSYSNSNPTAIITQQSTTFSGLPDFSIALSSPISTERNYYVSDAESNQVLFSSVLQIVVGNSIGYTATGSGGTQTFSSPTLPLPPPTLTQVSSTTIGATYTLGNAVYPGPNWNSISIASVTAGFSPDINVFNNASVPIISSPSFTFVVNLIGGDGSSYQIATGSATYQQGSFGSVSLSTVAPFQLSNSAQLQYVATPNFPNPAAHSCSVQNTDGTCKQGAYLSYNISASVNLLDLYAGAFTNSVSTVAGESIFGTLLPGSNQSINLAPGIALSGLNVTTQTAVNLAVSALEVPGYADVGNAALYQIEAANISNDNGISGSFKVTLPTAQAQNSQNLGPVQVLFYPNSNGFLNTCTPQVINPNGDGTFTASQFGGFKVVQSIYANPATVTLDGLTLVSNTPGATLSNPSSDIRYPQLLNVQNSLGYIPADIPVLAGPTGAAFTPPALLTVALPQSLTSSTQPAVAIVQQLSLDGTQTQLIPVSYAANCQRYTGEVASLHSLFGLFVATTPVPATDLLPPQTSLVIGTTTIAANTPAIAYPASSISLSALDPPYPGAPVSGVAHTYYLLDTPFLSTTTTPGQIYSAPFSLSLGTHTLSDYSVDNAGNVEAVNVSTISVVAPQSLFQGGRGIGVDAAGTEWTIAFSSGGVSFSHNDQNGVFLSSAALPDADPGILWSVLFDASGNPYAIGAAIGTNGADQLAIYEASPTSGAIVSSQTFDSGFNNNNYPFAVTGSGWIVGGVQTAGPISFNQNGNRIYQLAIWKFNPATGLIQLTTTTYARAGFDAGTGVAVDGAGNLWISGFSQSPSPLTANVFDLALWEFAPDGKTLLQGPFYRTGAIADLNLDVVAPIFLSTGVAYVASPRTLPSGQTNEDLATFRMSSGNLLTESGFQANDGSSGFPSAIVQDSSGNIVVAGGYNYADGTSAAGLWRYNPGGYLQSATLTDAGGTRGAAFNGRNLWFAVDGSTSPYLDNAESVAAGGLADVEPPRISVTATPPSGIGTILYAGEGSQFYLNVVDDAFTVGDGLGVGPVQTFLSIDASSFTVYTSSFSLAEGSYTLQYYSIDATGNASVIQSTTVAVDDTPPITTLLVLGSSVTDTAGVLLVSSSTPFALSAVDPVSNGVASGVAATYYVIDQYPFSPACENTPLDPTQPNGTCANEVYDSSFTLTIGTHTIYYFSDDLASNQETVNVASFTIVDTTNDALPPRTIGQIGPPSYSTGTITYVTSASTLGLVAVDDAITVGDGLGVGVATTYLSIDGGPFQVYTGTGSIQNEGLYTLSYYSVDLLGHTEAVHTFTIAADNTPPITTLQVLGSSTTDSSGYVDISAATPIALSAVDPISNGVASGVAATYYVIDVYPFSPGCESTPFNPTAPNGTCANDIYDSSFTLSGGTHTVYYFSEDNVGNQELVNVSSFSVSAPLTSPYALNPSTGPIGVPFTITGPGSFGGYAGSNTQVFIGTVSAPLSVWNDTTIQGTVPGLSTGSYAVTISTPSSGGPIFIANFTVTALSSATLTSSSGPIGSPFTFTGAGFGPYAGALTQVLIGGTTAPLSVWNDSQISGNIPFVSSGTQSVLIERAASGGGLETSASFAYQVTVPTITAISPSSGPIGVSYTLSGQSFGAYAGTLTQVLIGGTTTALSVWNNTTISGTVPGSLAAGTYPVQVEIMASGGGLVLSNTTYFQITGINLVSVTPSTGPIGTTYSLSGSGFGAYAGANTQVLIGGATTQLSVWNDTNIQGTIPTLASGTYSVVVERLQGAAMAYSAPSSFTVVVPVISTVSPGSGPLGTSFTLTGTGFGPYAGSLTRLLLAGTTCSLSVWNDTTISGTVPGGISGGPQPLVVQRVASDGGVVNSSSATFYVSAPMASSIVPSTGPIGVPFTISGSGFGNYAGSASQVRFGIGGSTAPLSVWNDSTISGSVPYLSTGAYAILVERVSGGVTSDTAVATFTVIVPAVSTVNPVAGPIGAAFTISGSGFGPYTGSGTQVLFGGVSTPLSVWNDSTVSGSVPGSLSGGIYAVTLLYIASGGSEQVPIASFTVTVPIISSITPNTGSAGDGVMLTGSGFGPYQGGASNVLVAGSTVSLSVWNDTEIVWTVPSSLANGTDAVVVSLTPSGGSVQSSSATFTVTGSGGGGGGGQGFMAFRPGFNIVSKPAVALADEPDWYFQGDLVFSTNVVASIVTPSGAAVRVPAGVLTKTSPLTLQRLPAASLAASNAAMAKQGLAAVGSAIEFGPTGLAFSQPVTITLPYDPSLVTTGELGAVAIYYFDPVADSWSALPTQMISGQFTLTTQTSHFSRYQPLHNGPLSPAIGGGGAFDVFGLRASYAFPNPSHHGAAVDLRIQPGLADSVDLHVYSSSGKRVLSTTLTAVNFIDDGNGLGPQDTYDYVWDVGGIGSGVYTFVFDAHRAGEHDVIATGKIGVIK
jgi:hypothetical protein